GRRARPSSSRSDVRGSRRNSVTLPSSPVVSRPSYNERRRDGDPGDALPYDGSVTTTTDRHDEARTTDRVGRGALTPARLTTFVLIALAVIAADQATKAAVRAWLAVGEVWPEDFELIRFARVENSGAAFGIFQDGGLFLVVASIVGVVGVALFLLWAPPH